MRSENGVKITKFSHNRNPVLNKISVHTSHHTFKLIDGDTRLAWEGGGMFSKGIADRPLVCFVWSLSMRTFVIGKCVHLLNLVGV